MIRTLIATLSAKRSDGLSVSNMRLEPLCLLVFGIASARTVNLSPLSGEMPTQAKVDSTYRRFTAFLPACVSRGGLDSAPRDRDAWALWKLAPIQPAGSSRCYAPLSRSFDLDGSGQDGQQQHQGTHRSDEALSIA